MLKGIGASQGYGIGNAVVISDAKLDYNHVEFTTAQNEKERLQKAVDTFIKETRKLADDVKKFGRRQGSGNFRGSYCYAFRPVYAFSNAG